jgi:hypothetical protein
VRQAKIRMAILLSLSPTVAFAYFDPGTGSLLIQAAIGGIAAITVFWGNLKTYARALFSKGKPSLPPTAADAHEPAEDSLDSK